MAKTGVTSNIPKAMREFDKSIEKLFEETQKIEASLAVQAMNEVRKSGLIKGEHDKDNKRAYEDIKSSDSGIITQRAKSQKGRTRDLNRYKHYGRVRHRERKYAPRDKGPTRIKRVFHKKKIAVRTGDFYRIFEKETKFTNMGGRLVQNRRQAKISVEEFPRKDGSKSIRFDFFGTEGKSLRMLSYGTRREQPLKIDGGKQLKGRKGKRDVVANAIRKTMNRHNRLLTKYIQSDYKKRFDNIK